MANDLTPKGGKLTLPHFVNEDEGISSPLWWAIEMTQNPHPNVGRPKEFHPAVKREAQRVLDKINPLCAPAGVELVTLWATPLLAGLSKATDEQENVTARMRLVIMALQDLAAGAFTQGAQTYVTQNAHFAPMPADLYDAVYQRSAELRRRQEHLRYIVEAQTERHPAPPQEARVVPLREPVQPSSLPEPTPEEINAERVRQLRALGYDEDGKPLDGAA